MKNHYGYLALACLLMVALAVLLLITCNKSDRVRTGYIQTR